MYDTDNIPRYNAYNNNCHNCITREDCIQCQSIGRYSNMPKLHRILASGRLPKTQAIVETYAETVEQWQHRKILWAIQQMRENGEVITVYKVRHRATIGDPARKLEEYIAACIMDNV